MPPKKPKLHSLLLITGSKRNIGKTTLACRVINLHSKETDLTAIKISSHFHENTPGLKLLAKTENFILFKELNRNTNKDSSRMLNAGAKHAFYFEVKKGKIKQAFNFFLENHDPGMPIICESGSLAQIFEPGVRLHLITVEGKNTGEGIQIDPSINQYHLIYDSEKSSWPIISKISINCGHWTIDKEEQA